MTTLIYILNFKYNLLGAFLFSQNPNGVGNFFDGIKEYITLKKGMIAFGFVSLLTFLLKDLMTSKLFIKEAKKIREKNDLKSKVVGLYQAYVQNEKKIYERVMLMSKMSRLNDIEEMIWANMDNLGKLQFDFNYWHRDLSSSVDLSMQSLMKNYLKSDKLRVLTLKQSVVNFLIKNTTLTLFEDTLCVLLKVINKNPFLLKGEVLDIEDFYAGKMDLYEYYLKLIQDHYQKLRKPREKGEGITLEKKEYKKRFLHTTNQVNEEDEEDDDDDFMEADMSSLSVISSRSSESGYAQIRKTKRMSIFLKKDFVTANDEDESKVIDKLKNKEKKSLAKASNLIFNELIAQRERGQDDLFLKKELENMDTFECKYGKRRIVFFNLETNFLKKTKGFMKVSLRLILGCLIKFLISNFEIVVSIALLVHQLMHGAFENLIILGILFFFILTEVHRGYNYWWRILFFCFLIKCFCKYSSKIYIEGQNGDADKQFNFYQPMNILLLLFGNVEYITDVFCLILIFFLLQILKRKGFAHQRMFEYEDPGSCTARIILNEYKVDIYDNEAKFLMYKNELQNAYLLEKLKRMERKDTLGTYRNYRLDLIKQRIYLSILHDLFKKEFMNQMIIYLKRTRNDMLKATKENINHFMWRNFSYYVIDLFKSKLGKETRKEHIWTGNHLHVHSDISSFDYHANDREG